MNYKMNEAKVYADINDENMVLLDFSSGIYFSVNKFGTEVFQNLNNGAKLESIIEESTHLANAPSDISERIKTFVKQLCEYDVIIESGESNEPAKLNEEIAADDNYELIVIRYDDAQEMLLADPIHEVKEEEGWSPETSSLNTDEEDVRKRESKFDGILHQ